jgi:hypothetical protein
MGIIMYELLSGQYLFDIYNENKKNGKHFKHFNLNEKSKATTNYGENTEYSYEHENKIEYLSLLYMYKFILGDNDYINKYDNNYYSDNGLLGDIRNNNFQNNIIPFITENCLVSNDKDKICTIFQKIFIYNYNLRLTSEEFLTKYMF